MDPQGLGNCAMTGLHALVHDVADSIHKSTYIGEYASWLPSRARLGESDTSIRSPVHASLKSEFAIHKGAIFELATSSHCATWAEILRTEHKGNLDAEEKDETHDRERLPGSRDMANKKLR